MTSYKCNVVDISGKKRKLTHKAETKSEVIDYLKKNNYIIIDIEKSAGSIDFNIFGKERIKSKDLAVFCKQLYAMLKAGVTLVNSLEILRQQTDNKQHLSKSRATSP